MRWHRQLETLIWKSDENKMQRSFFVQQTIADIEITIPGDIASDAYYIAQKDSVHIHPCYVRNTKTNMPTRV